MKTPTILFLCVHNAGRSQMAAGFAKTLGAQKVTVWSAGSNPSEQLNPAVVTVMAEEGIDITKQIPTRLTVEMGLSADVIVTMGCGDACPVYPGKQYVDWAIADPAGLDVDSVRLIRDEIRTRVQRLIAELT